MSAEAEPIVSVVIPSRDRRSFLREAVGSVLAQSLSRCEAIVVDDASTDGTQTWLATHSDDRVVTIRLEDHAERAVARNRGLERARGDFVLFLDDDDRLRVSALKRLHAALMKNPRAVGAVGARVLFNADGQRRRLPHPRRPLERVVWPELLAGWMSPPGTTLYRAELVREVGGWNEAITLSGDRELFLRVARRGTILFVPEVVLYKRAHGGQRRASDTRERKAEWMRAYVNSLPPVDRSRALAAMQANRLCNDARIAYGNLRLREAISLYFRAARTMPLALTSPLLRRSVVGGMAKSLLALLAGRRALVWARSMKERLLWMLGRSVRESKQEVESS
jgi:glycosyltransferase involved in cell wall biosynthesis